MKITWKQKLNSLLCQKENNPVTIWKCQVFQLDNPHVSVISRKNKTSNNIFETVFQKRVRKCFNIIELKMMQSYVLTYRYILAHLSRKYYLKKSHFSVSQNSNLFTILRGVPSNRCSYNL